MQRNTLVVAHGMTALLVARDWTRSQSLDVQLSMTSSW